MIYCSIVLLKNGANVHSRDKGGLIALHNACSYGHYDVAKLLLEVTFK
jgi:ankyrin repeat protein